MDDDFYKSISESFETCVETTNLDVYLPNPKFAMAGKLSVRLHDRLYDYAFLFVLKSVHAYWQSIMRRHKIITNKKAEKPNV